MRITLMLLCFAIFIPVASAQVTHIYYDAYYDSTYFKRDGQIIEQPQFKRGDRVELHVTNYNDYLYALKVEAQEEQFAVPSADFSSLLFGGMGSGGLGQLRELLGTGGAGSAFESIMPDNGSFGFASEDAAESLTQEAKSALRQFNRLLKDVQEIEEEIDDRNDFLEKVIQGQEHQVFLRSEISRLRQDASLEPKVNREIMLEYLEKLLDIDEGGNYDLEDMLDQTKTQNRFQRGIDFYEQDVARYASKVTEVNLFIQSIEEVGLPTSYQLQLENTGVDLEVRSGQLTEKVATLREKAPSLLPNELEHLAALRYQYEALKSHRFEKTVTLYPKSDVTTLIISLQPLDSLAGKVPTKRANPIRMESYGGIQINASVGISFASFFDQPQQYTNPNGEILGDNLDAFSPIITSFIHFYGKTKREVSLAGTLSLGLGLGGDQDAGLTNYFLGPSLIIGNQQRIVLTGGLMGGRVNRLANGLSVGDVFVESTIPLKTVYELGVFFGVSFNLGGN